MVDMGKKKDEIIEAEKQELVNEPVNEPEWKEKKVSLGNAIIIGAVLAVLGVLIGANWQNMFPGMSQYFGGVNNSRNWSELDEVYDKLKSTYNGEINQSLLLEGAKSGMVEAVGDIYTVYMDKEESASYVNTTLHGNVVLVSV